MVTKQVRQLYRTIHGYYRTVRRTIYNTTIIDTTRYQRTTFNSAIRKARTFQITIFDKTISNRLTLHLNNVMTTENRI